MPVTKAVIPAAGLGTRFLPATKAMPKEMLPIVDKPVIQYVVEEAVRSGMNDLLMVTGRNKNALENHFDRASEIEDALSKKGDTKKLDEVSISNRLADIHYMRQGDPRGLGHAILRAKKHVSDQSFAVLLGDDLIDERDQLLSTMLEVHEQKQAHVIALMEVEPEQIHMYGCAEIEGDGDVVKIKNLVEKPDNDKAPSNLAVIGRYVLRPEIFGVLEKTEPGRGNEIQITDALRTSCSDSDQPDVYGVVFRGRRYDTGDKVDYIKASLRIAVDREDIGEELRGWLKEFSKQL